MVTKRRGGKKPPNGREPLARETAPPSPGSAGPDIVYMPGRQAGVRVTEDTALTLGSVFACVRLISEDLAGLPCRVHETRADGGSDERPDDPADWLLHWQSNPETPAFFFRETLTAHALTWGNGYAEIERDGAGRPVWLWQLTPDRVKPVRSAGRIVYQVKNPRQSDTVLEAEDVFHLRGLGFDGLQGYSVVHLAARSIGLGISLDENAAQLYANDSTPGGLLTHPGRLSDAARLNLRKTWQERHGGPKNRRTVAVLEEGMGWEQTGLAPEDAQLVQQRGLTPADICRWFRVKPHKIADLTRSTYSNIEEENTGHVTDTLLPWARRLEAEANVKLFGRTNRGRRFVKVNFNALMRGNAGQRSAYYTSMFNIGVLSDNEIRHLEDMNPVGPDGDKRFVPLNMQLLEKAGEEPPPPKAPPPGDGPPGNPPPGGNGKAPAPKPAERQRAVDPNVILAPVLADACERVRRRLAREGVGPLADASIANVVVYARDALMPSVVAIARASGAPEAAGASALAAVLGEFSRRLVRDPAAATLEAAHVTACVAAACAALEVSHV